MNLPTHVSREVAERVPQPGFDAVVDRAQHARRRRRTTIASGLAVAVVVAGVGFAVGRPGGGDDQRPEPARPGPSTPWDGTPEVDSRLPATVQSFLRGARLQPWSFAGSDTGAAVVWGSCAGDGPCTYALTVRDGDEVAGRLLEASAPTLTAVPGGWIYEDVDEVSLLTPSGTFEPVVDTGSGSTDVEPGDTAVRTRAGWRILRGTKLIGLPGAGTWQPSSAYVTPGGRLVLAPGVAGPRRVVVSDGDLQWEMTHVADPGADSTGTGLLAGNGDHLAYVLLGDDPDGSVTGLHVALSSDAGDTWTTSEGMERSVYQDVSGLAMSRQGTAYLVTGSHGLVRIDADGNEVGTPMSPHDMGVLTSGDEVCVVAGAGAVDELRCSSDDGTTWAPRPLPGFG
ncbi:hypothetical protein EUA93_01780 [Nocardioides oleivorans]|uniref:Exo-alpha-sialidase n=1 Tax=Nocardioides oleivorans TaxID=273676 RepID=A0A4Q2RVI5_9ACTN|nr:hypothetical protein [Nocardioides oleivorans]RYB93191.1 hypothetical protein EUA93_01780 [Nocardioides oleivorans]